MSLSRKKFFLIATLILISALIFTLCSCDWFSDKEETEYITEDIARGVLVDTINSLKSSSDFKITMNYEDHDSNEDLDITNYIYATTGTDSAKIVYMECSAEYEDDGYIYYFYNKFYLGSSGDNDNKYIGFAEYATKNQTIQNSSDDEEGKFYSILSQSDFKDYSESFFDETAGELTQLVEILRKTGTIISSKKISNKKNTKYEINLLWEESRDSYSALLVIENDRLTSAKFECDEYKQTFSVNYDIKPLSLPDKDDYEYQKYFM